MGNSAATKALITHVPLESEVNVCSSASILCVYKIKQYNNVAYESQSAYLLVDYYLALLNHNT